MPASSGKITRHRLSRGGDRAANNALYHIALVRSLRPAPPKWWLRPVSFHGRLDAAGRRRVMPWFYAGAVGFVITVFGLVLVGISVWRSR